MTATVGDKLSETSLKDWVNKKIPEFFEKVGRVHNKMEGADDAPEAWVNKTPLSNERAKKMTAMQFMSTTTLSVPQLSATLCLGLTCLSGSGHR